MAPRGPLPPLVAGWDTHRRQGPTGAALPALAGAPAPLRGGRSPYGCYHPPSSSRGGCCLYYSGAATPWARLDPTTLAGAQRPRPWVPHASASRGGARGGSGCPHMPVPTPASAGTGPGSRLHNLAPASPGGAAAASTLLLRSCLGCHNKCCSEGQLPAPPANLYAGGCASKERESSQRAREPARDGGRQAGTREGGPRFPLPILEWRSLPPWIT